MINKKAQDTNSAFYILLFAIILIFFLSGIAYYLGVGQGKTWSAKEKIELKLAEIGASCFDGNKTTTCYNEHFCVVTLNETKNACIIVRK